jgi:hypothetical protein
VGTVDDATYFDWQTREVNESMRLTIAYPTLWSLYGRADLNEMDKVIRSDAAQLRDLIFSGGNYLPAQSAAFVRILEVDKSNPLCWYQYLDIDLIYTTGQSLT